MWTRVMASSTSSRGDDAPRRRPPFSTSSYDRSASHCGSFGSSPPPPQRTRATHPPPAGSGGLSPGAAAWARVGPAGAEVGPGAPPAADRRSGHRGLRSARHGRRTAGRDPQVATVSAAALNLRRADAAAAAAAASAAPNTKTTPQPHTSSPPPTTRAFAAPAHTPTVTTASTSNSPATTTGPGAPVPTVAASTPSPAPAPGGGASTNTVATTTTTATGSRLGRLLWWRRPRPRPPPPGSTTSASTLRRAPAPPVQADDNWANDWLVIDPGQPIYYTWLIVVSTAVLYNLVFVIGRAVFWGLHNAAPRMWWLLDYTCDAVYLIDTIMHMHEGYLEQGLLVRDASRLRRHYLASRRWRLDVLSLLPTDIAYAWWDASECSGVPCSAIVRLNRLLRLPRVGQCFDRVETRTSFPNAFRIFKVVLAILVLIHWNACIYFAISYFIGFEKDKWVYSFSKENNTLIRQYMYSFYWSTLTLTTIGETPQPERDIEYAFVVLDFLAGVLIFATIVGNIGSMISNMNVSRVNFRNRMDDVKQYMAFRRVSPELEAHVIRWFTYTWANQQALDEERALSALPDKLKAEIAIHVHLDTLREVCIFRDCEPGLLEELVLKLRLQVFSPGDYICRKGDVGKEMYIVKRGRLSVVADDGKTVLATLGPGSVFGEVSVLEIAGNRTGNRRTATVCSLGYSDLFCLDKRDLWEVLKEYPEARMSLVERGCALLRKDGLLDEEAHERAERCNEPLTAKVARLETSVEHVNKRLARLLGEFCSHQCKVKRRLTSVERRTGRTSARTSVGWSSEDGEGWRGASPETTRRCSIDSQCSYSGGENARVGGGAADEEDEDNEDVEVAMKRVVTARRATSPGAASITKEDLCVSAAREGAASSVNGDPARRTRRSFEQPFSRQRKQNTM